MAQEPDSTSDVLSQTEVEAILASLQTETTQATPIVGGKKGKEGAVEEPPNIQGYDFRSPVFLSPEKLRRLRIKHEDFIRNLAGRISTYLRKEFSIQMSRLETMSYANMLETLPMPSHLTLFKLNPLKGMYLFDLSPRLGLTVLDRMMGGPGHSIRVEREFTDIESSVLVNFIQLVIKEYAESWLKYQRLEWEIVEHENTARFLNLAAADDIMLYLEMEARFGDVVAGMRFVLPYVNIEDLVGKLMAEIAVESKGKHEKVTVPSDPRSPIYQIPVPISAHWRGFSMTLRDVNSLAVGDVVCLNNQKCENVVVDLGRVPKFYARLEPGAKQVAVSLVSKIN